MMICPKCASDHVNVERIVTRKKKKRGCLYWIFFGWLFEILFLIWFTVPYLIYKIFWPKKFTEKYSTQGVCQNCGYTWKI